MEVMGVLCWVADGLTIGSVNICVSIVGGCDICVLYVGVFDSSGLMTGVSGRSVLK